MIGFNALLREEGIDPKEVKLARHQDTRWVDRPTPYQLWTASDGRFERYQRIQKRNVFQGARVLASFVATPLGESLFVSLYEIRGMTTAAPGLIDPLSSRDVGGMISYDLVPMRKLVEYRGRLIVDWGLGYRSWVQLAAKKDKPLLEIRRTAAGERSFPGFLDFREKLSELKAVPLAWRAALSSVSGIYLLVHPETGKQYVGSAQGMGGFWGRWEQYVASGHGGNRRMKDVPTADYQVSVLEVASSSANAEVLTQMEKRWKQKLLSRKFGLNAN